MAATLYAFKVKSVLFERDFSLEFETYLSKQIPHFFAVKEPAPAKMSRYLTMRESYFLRTKLTANTSECIAKVAESLFFHLTNIGPVPG
jgi:hypothetical protein